MRRFLAGLVFSIFGFLVFSMPVIAFGKTGQAFYFVASAELDQGGEPSGPHLVGFVLDLALLGHEEFKIEKLSSLDLSPEWKGRKSYLPLNYYQFTFYRKV